MSWSRRFDAPILLPDGTALVTLRDAGTYIAALPKRTQDKPAWQAAAEALLLVAERGGPTMLARIGVMRALNENRKLPAPEPRRKRARVYRVIS